jgi:hypothetical protein
MAKSKMTTPQPIAVTTICSVCGLNWELHGEDPTTDDCIQLLKAALASKSTYAPIIIKEYVRPYVQPYASPYVQPYVLPYVPTVPFPHSPIWCNTSHNNTINCQSDQPISYNTPRTIESTCHQIAV